MTRFRDTGLVVGERPPGPLNAITDVPGVAVGHVTLIEGDGPLVVGRGPVRTGVTVVLPHPGDVWNEPLAAGFHVLNGCGEVTGMHWVRESGMLASPVALTGTLGVGAVHEGLVRWAAEDASPELIAGGVLPVVAETWDGHLSDGFGTHVRPVHVAQAIAAATTGPVPEGNVGGGTGMICHGFKGGIGTSSRRVALPCGDYRLGVLVQANHGVRERFVVDGVPIGRRIPDAEVPVPPDVVPGSGSIISLVATDVPLLPHQCRRVAQRVGLAIGRLGGLGEDGSGDMALAFSTANRLWPPVRWVGGEDPPPEGPALATGVEALVGEHIDEVFAATVEATEEAILNALFAAETMVGRDGVVAYALPQDRFLEEIARR
ncbi:MAG TPA: P1 family peptidase [Thermoleophilia bacterium]|nr:P1 family peptidase [Acidobacteriota bacterium]NLT92881.1 P1 family peptidase [Actinomycetota bacterium]HOU28981.1 P1 family peptidase [Thermoleophilia bacterium]HQF53191.1 P1 family peptidase [Thermoleophilia bacterium]HQH22095.1 P1 family peptidase [Thermoleophilia bacterium]